MKIDYKIDEPISPQTFRHILVMSELGERRPVDDMVCLKAMVEHADLMITAWLNDEIIGVARSVTDFNYCCYLSDLAVSKNHQHKGIGKKLIALTQQQLVPTCSLILLSAPAAQEYYPKIGFDQHQSAWILRRGKDLT